MANSVYSINKGVNKSIEFKGLKAQYIWYLGGGLIGLLVLFAILYIAGVNSFICIGIIIVSAVFLFVKVYRLSNKYGEHGLMKELARRQIPKTIISRSRKVFFNQKVNNSSRGIAGA
jgi:hypothetical protein